MKKIILTAGMVCLTLIVSSCGGGSKKGAWTEADKSKFNSECNGVKEIQDLGQQGKDLCDCMLKKAEVTFDDFAQCDSDEATDEKLAKDCFAEVMNK
ncbi:MAG: hypothetical protein ACJ75J_07810 [Cytophagaceae bacterium]